MELSHYEQNCRLCLKAHNASKNIFNHVIDGCQETLVQIIFTLFKIELDSHQAYPQFICRKCLTEMENILLFKEDLLRNQDFLIGLFKDAYPNYVDKKTSNSIKFVTSNDVVDLTSQGTSEYLKLAEDFSEPLPQVKLDHELSSENHLTIKNETFQTMSDESHGRLVCKYCNKSFRFKRTLQDHYAKAYCLGEIKRDGINADRTTRDSWKKIFGIQQLGTDENKNVPFEHLPHQEIEFRQTDINENKSNIDSARISQEKTLHDIPAEPTIPQASFLQNLNLITLQDAEILKTQQEPLSKTRPRLISSKYKVPKTINKIPINLSKAKDIVHKRKRKTLTTFSKKTATNKNSPDLFINRSVNFLSRYGCRKYNKTYLKRGKVILKTDKPLSFNQRNKNVNKCVTKQKKSSKDGGTSSVGPSSLLEKALDKSKAVSKRKGCENDSNLVNNESKQDSLSLKPKLETIICTDSDSKEGSLTGNSGIGMPRFDNTVANTTGKVIVDRPTGKTCIESVPQPSASNQQGISSEEHQSIPPKRFYQYMSRTGEYCSVRRKDLPSSKKKSFNHQDNANSSAKYQEPDNNDFKIKLFRSSSINVQPSPDGEAKTAILSIGEAPALISDHKEDDFRKNLRIHIERCPRNLKIERSISLDKSNEAKLIEPKELEKPNSRFKSEGPKPFNKVDGSKSPTTNIMGSWTYVETNSGPTTKRTRVRKFENVSADQFYDERADKEQVDLTTDIAGAMKSCEVGSVSEIIRRGSQKFENAPSIDLSNDTTREVDKINQHADLRKTRRLSNRIGNSHTTTTGITEDRRHSLRRKSKSKSVDIDMVFNLISYAANDKVKHEYSDSLKKMSRTAEKKIKLDVSAEHEPEEIICQRPIRISFTDHTTKSKIFTSNSQLSHEASTSQNAKDEVDSASQILNDKHQIDNNIGLRMKLRKTAASESIKGLEYFTQKTNEHKDGLLESQSMSSLKESNVYRKKSLVNHPHDKIRNVTVSVDQEFQLTVIQADLSEFSGDRPKRNFQAKYEENPINSLEKHLIKQGKDAEYVEMPKSSLNGSCQSSYVETCKKGLLPVFLDSPIQSKRVGRRRKRLPLISKTHRSKPRLCKYPNKIHKKDTRQMVPKPYKSSIQTRSKYNKLEVVENGIRDRPSKSNAAHKTRKII